jgi:DNA-binding PadR family transcriptional regulator
MYGAAMAPLREPTYFILASLLDGPLHGYGVAQRAHELSEGSVTLTAGTLYGAFERLVKDGLVEGDREEVVQGRRRRYYRLTREGRERLAAEAERLHAAANVVRARRAVTA